jgi:NAD+ diphosphatase
MSKPFEPALLAPASFTEAPLWFLCSPEAVLVRETAGGPEIPRAEDRSKLIAGGGAPHYLGALRGVGCFCAGVPSGTAAPQGFSFVSLRRLLGTLPEELIGVAGRAVQIVAWDRDHAFCGRCGAPTALSKTERARRCEACNLSFWPRVAPAVIMLVRRGREALLARSGRFPLPFFSTLAGFVEPGESLEDAVARELLEEVGVEIDLPRYFGSQPWPFPNSLMLGFTANYIGGEVRPDGEEIVEAGWYTPEALPLVPPPFSIARRLIDAWVLETTGHTGESAPGWPMPGA